MKHLYLLVLTIIFIGFGCSKKETKTENFSVEVEAEFFSKRDTLQDVDSPAFWHGPNGENWIILTAKRTDLLHIYNAETGELVKYVGQSGSELGSFKRPNGVFVTNDMAFIVDRDNHRIQVLSLPDFEPLLTFGGEQLLKPYGIYLYYLASDSMRVFVTDDFEADPNGSQENRIKVYTVAKTKDEFTSRYEFSFGDKSKPGALFSVESIWGDPKNNTLLIADEDENDIKVYALDGTFTGKVIANGLIKGDPEGIVLYTCGDNGFWIATDQGHDQNIFYLFDRLTLKKLGFFKVNSVLNTDGIALTQKAFGNNKLGAFSAVHDDGNIVAVDISKVLSEISSLPCN